MKNENEAYIDIPEVYSRVKLNAMYREIPLKDTCFRLLRKYFNAMAHLYGFIPLRKAWEIIDKLDPKLVNKQEFFAFAEIARHECEDYTILKNTELYLDAKPTGRLDWKIIDNALLFDDNGALEEMEQYREGKDYFLPPKAELLQYADAAYCEPSIYSKRMKSFLLGTLHLSKSKADIVFESILLTVRTNGSLQEVVDLLDEFGIVFTERMVAKLASVYMDFVNNTRLPHNCGYTPTEAAALLGREKRSGSIINFKS